jgi:hypothetical protein
MSKWEWLKDKAVDAVMVVIFGGLALLVGNGVLQSYLPPYELEKASMKMKEKFTKDIAEAERQAIKRESDILAAAEEAKVELAKAVIEAKTIVENKAINEAHLLDPKTDQKANWKKIEGLSKGDPDKAKLEFLNSQQKEIDVRQAGK